MSYPDRRPAGLTLAEAFAWYVPVPVGDCLLWPAATTGNGYGCFRHGGRCHLAHVVAYTLLRGPLPPGIEVDHADCVGRTCVRGDHLRAATRKQNQENRHVLQPSNASGIRGVSWHKATGKWTARVQHAGHVYAAYFHDKDEAAEWALAKRLELFTHNAVDRRCA